MKVLDPHYRPGPAAHKIIPTAKEAIVVGPAEEEEEEEEEDMTIKPCYKLPCLSNRTP